MKYGKKPFDKVLLYAKAKLQELIDITEYLNECKLASKEENQSCDALEAARLNALNALNMASKYLEDVTETEYRDVLIYEENLKLKCKLQGLIKELNRIANDYIPDNGDLAPLALEEMRNAIGTLFEAAKEGG